MITEYCWVKRGGGMTARLITEYCYVKRGGGMTARLITEYCWVKRGVLHDYNLFGVYQFVVDFMTLTLFQGHLSVRSINY